MTTAEIEWIFDRSPASGARTGGNVAEYAFRPDVETLVREVNQNILDNARSDAEPAQAKFRLIRLQGAPLQQFLNAMRWSQVRQHIEGAAQERSGLRFKQALQRFEESRSLLLLIIEDRNTTGLVGDETGAGSNFAALCRNTLDSNKPSETSGGSYGLGKAVLWLFSGFSTVLFNSVLETDPAARTSPRFIGRTELPWHRVAEHQYSGSGWLGTKNGGPNGDWASSVWSPETATLAEALHLDRDSATGTSILVAGFHNPADEDQDPQSISQKMVTATARNFWPSVIGRRLEIEIEVSEANRAEIKRRVTEDDVSPSFAACWNAYKDRRTSSELTKVGDVAEVPISLKIPARIDGSAPTMSAEATLVARLASEEEEDANQVAFFRATGMVVKYESYSRLALMQRPFHAILVCGKARRAPDITDVALDEFLRAAEPPEHKNWEATTRLKEIYKQGYSKLLKDMETKIKEELRKLVCEKAPGGTEGPELLMNLFPLGTKSSPPPPRPKLFTVADLRADLRDGIWRFSGRIVVRDNNRKRWQAEVDLSFQAEDAADSSGAVVLTVAVDAEAARQGTKVKVKEGVGRITAPAAVRELEFTATTDPDRYPIDVRHTTVSVDVRPRLLGAKQNGQ